VEEIPIPEIGDDEVLVRVRAAGICGSDVHMYEGADSYKVFEQYMPLVMGHEFCGDIAETGKNVVSVKPGDRVVCRPAVACGDCYYCRSNRMHFCSDAFKRILGLQKNGGFAEYVAVSADGCIPLPANLSYEIGALVEPLGVTGNAVNDADVTLGETVVIQGPGPIGLLTLLHARARGAGKCIVIGTEKDSVRLEKAREFDADHIIVADKEDPVKAVLDLTDGRGVNVVFEASGVPQLIQSALNMCEKTGRVVVEGIYGSTGAIDFTPMVRSAKKLIGTYGGLIAWDRIIAWLGTNSHYAKLASGVITHKSALDDAEAAFERSVHRENIKELFVMD
jgi:2-desacetyl-2-hydroxyethyl bacteriochlorophyllide A dehydrogenase